MLKSVRALRNRLFLTRRYPKLDGFYSQYGQDFFLVNEIFNHTTNGFFVDIGAHDGVTLSNTYYLEKNLSWKGICIEANPDAYERLRRNRNCLCIQAAISAQRGGNMRFLRIEGYSQMLSGLIDKYDPRHVERIRKELDLYGGKAEEIMVPNNNLNELLAKSSVRRVDYLSVDVEGSELEILQSLDFGQVNYRVIGAENNYGDDKIEKHMNRHGFKLVAVVGSDEFYVDKKRSPKAREARAYPRLSA